MKVDSRGQGEVQRATVGVGLSGLMVQRSLLPLLALVLLAVLPVVAILNSSNSARTAAELSVAGEAALVAGQWEQAIAHFRELVELDPDHRDAEKLAQALDASIVYVPAGEFLMGSDTGDLDERPQRRVYLDAFEIDRYEVTNAQYRRFLLATGHEPPQPWPGRYTAFRPEHDPDWQGTEYPDGEALHPVVGVNWTDAVTYCAWAGKRLPTEAEWEKAARGTDGRAFPWGDEWDADKANVGETGTGYTQPVGSYPAGASPYSALDMAGNTWEWVIDLYDRQYYALAPDHNPPGPASGTGEQILRGGAWDSPPQHVRVAFRNATHCFGPNHRAGFRCARSIGDSARYRRTKVLLTGMNSNRQVRSNFGCAGEALGAGIRKNYRLGAAAGVPVQGKVHSRPSYKPRWSGCA
jgi:sulfatase modifying factor 1